jgi:hypothetical protein
MQRRKNKKENEREKLFQVKRKKCAQKGLDREDIVRDVRFGSSLFENDCCFPAAAFA